MLGRVRASSSSVESLERPPSKILKDDSFSVYEATLMKLKLGSQRNSSLPLEEEAVEMESDCSATTDVSTSVEVINLDEETMTVDPDCSRFGAKVDSEEELRSKKNVSVRYLFSRYNKFRLAPTQSDEEETVTTVSNGSASTSPGCRSVGGTKEQPEHEYYSSSSSVCDM